jgi:hypothetical protein
VRHLKSSLEGAAHLKSADPLDQFTKYLVERVLAQVALGEEAEVVYAYETIEANGRCCSVNTVGHVSGLAWYDAEHTKFSIHPTFGPWFAYRAVITFPSRTWAKGLPGSWEGPLKQCPCPLEELQKVAAVQADVNAKWGTVSERESWNGLIRVSETFTQGTEHRYCPQQMLYHYSPDFGERTEILNECTA